MNDETILLVEDNHDDEALTLDAESPLRRGIQ
jgi:hypothetical protein